MASSFPKLIGFVPSQDVEKEHYRRVSAAKQEANRDVKNVPTQLYQLPREKPIEAPNQSGALNEEYLSSSHSVHQAFDGRQYAELYQPNWVKLDKHVLRFFGFFKESAVESNLETYRLRKLIMFFYLEDGSLSAIEPKQTNSGIPQGDFLKRQKVLKSDGSGYFISVFDLRVGGEVVIFGKNVKIYDCDEYTREFYDSLGLPQDYPRECPEDNFEKVTYTKYVPQKDKMMMDYLEHKLGGGRMPSQKQFLENDRKVLRFFAYSEIPFVLHYYLADDTLEVREIKIQNSGYDPFPVYLKRQKLRKNFALNQPGQNYEQEYIKPEDIKFAEELNIFGRIFQVSGCDIFTSRYYKEKFNREFPVGGVPQQRTRHKHNMIIPPYNGFGDEQDSLGYVYKLIPQPPKKDYFKWVDQQIQLRFKAKMNTTAPEDIDRFNFFSNSFAQDFHYHLLPKRRFHPNLRAFRQKFRYFAHFAKFQIAFLGRPEGKFLEKSQYKNMARNNEIFKPMDLIVGKDIKINGYSFHLIECDEYTKKWYEDNLAK